MAKSPVHRALFVLFIAAAIVAILLMLAQDQVTLKVRSAAGASEPRHAAYIAGLVGSRFDVRERLRRPDQWRPDLPADARGHPRAKRRISFETYIYESGIVADQFTAALEEAAHRGVRVNMVVDSVGGSGMKKEDIQRLEAAGCRDRRVQLADLVLARGGQLPHPPQDPRRRRRSRIYRRRRSRRPLARARAGQGALARHADPDARADRPAARGGVLRELHRNRRRGHAGARRRAAASCTRAARQSLIRSSPTGGSNDLKRLYLLRSPRRAIRSTSRSPYFVTDESSDWAFGDAVAPRRQGPHPRRRATSPMPCR